MAGRIATCMDPDRNTVRWDWLRSEILPRVMAKYDMVSWNYHITETFRRHHPELVVERP
jgi:hypothetical protein